MPKKTLTLHRDVLFKQVWSKPMAKLAKDYGLSTEPVKAERLKLIFVNQYIHVCALNN